AVGQRTQIARDTRVRDRRRKKRIDEKARAPTAGVQVCKLLFGDTRAASEAGRDIRSHPLKRAREHVLRDLGHPRQNWLRAAGPLDQGARERLGDPLPYCLTYRLRNIRDDLFADPASFLGQGHRRLEHGAGNRNVVPGDINLQLVRGEQSLDLALRRGLDPCPGDIERVERDFDRGWRPIHQAQHTTNPFPKARALTLSIGRASLAHDLGYSLDPSYGLGLKVVRGAEALEERRLRLKRVARELIDEPTLSLPTLLFFLALLLLWIVTAAPSHYLAPN